MSEKILTLEPRHGIFILQKILLWCENWREGDFQEAFKDSPIGWDYHWKKLLGKMRNGNHPTAAIVDVITSMDNRHQEMLYTYLMTHEI